MFDKIKIHILLALALLAFPGFLAADGENGSGALNAFSGSEALRQAVWRLAAFMPPGAPGDGGRRTLTVEDVSGLPPVTVSMTFDEFLDPWPSRLTIMFKAEASDPPVFFTMEDQRPFGGPNLRLDGAAPADARSGKADKTGETEPRIFLDIITRLNERLLAARPKLGAVKWRENAPGFEIARTRLLFGARLGPDDLFLARFDPSVYTFRPYHESEFPDGGPTAMSGWADRIKGAAAIINGGQYYPDRSYMGLLARDGQSLSSTTHPQWKGFLAASPRPDAPPGAPAAAIIDLHGSGREPWKPEHYHNVMQSFMLLDHNGIVRVRNSRNLAGRAAVGQDKAGRIVLIMTPAAVTLYDLALVLKDPRLELVRVMGLDGGFETQLLLRQGGAPFQSGGQFSISDKRAVFIPGYYKTLPSVLAVELLRPEPEAAPAPAMEGPQEPVHAEDRERGDSFEP